MRDIYETARDALEANGYDVDHTPVDVLMSAPYGVGLDVAYSEEFDADA